MSASKPLQLTARGKDFCAKVDMAIDAIQHAKDAAGDQSTDYLFSVALAESLRQELEAACKLATPNEAIVQLQDLLGTYVASAVALQDVQRPTH